MDNNQDTGSTKDNQLKGWELRKEKASMSDEEFYLNVQLQNQAKKERQKLKKKPKPKYLLPKKELIENVNLAKSRITMAGRQQLVNYTLKEILAGKTRQELIVYFAKEYNYSKWSVDKLIQDASQIMSQQTDIDKLSMKDKIYSMYIDLFRDAKEKGSVKDCTVILQSISKMFGLNAPDQLEVSGEIIRFEFDLPNASFNKDINIQAEDISFEEIQDRINSNKLPDYEEPIPDNSEQQLSLPQVPPEENKPYNGIVFDEDMEDND